MKYLLIFLAGCLAVSTSSYGSEIYHAQGEMAGEVTDKSALLQSRLTSIPGPDLDSKGDVPGAAGVACFEWTDEPVFNQPKRTPWVTATPEADYIVRAQLEDLHPRTRYSYRLVYGPDKDHTVTGPIRRFHTLGPDNPKATLSFCLGNCMNYYGFISGNSNGGGPATATDEDKRLGYPAFVAMQKLKPDFFVGAGDSVYYDIPSESPARTLPEMRKKWHEQFRFPRLISFFAECPAFWLKDDHDFRFDDADLTGNQMPSPALGEEVFLEQLPLFMTAEKNQQTYRTYLLHPDLQIWFLEGRDFRSPNSMDDGPTKSIWGEKQRRWLQNTLEDSKATWKILVTPTPLVGPDRAAKSDNHTNPKGFRQEAESFFHWLKEKNIENVLFFCGDRHWQYHSIDPTGFEEYSMGALNDENSISGIKPGEKDSTDPEGKIKQVFLYPEATGGFLYVQCVQRTDGTPEMLIEFRDDHGKVLHREVRTPTPPALK